MVVLLPEVLVCEFVVAPELVTSALTDSDVTAISSKANKTVRFTLIFFVIIWLAP